MIDFQTDPSRYRHWKLSFDGPVATLTMDVDPSAPLLGGYELKLNSYDLGVDIELADAVTRLRFEHPEVGAVILRSGNPGVFCAGANIRMLAKASHGHKVNFCKFTNETRLAIEDACANSNQHGRAEPSQRLLRVGELVRHALADMLARGEVHDPVLENHLVTVPEVRMSPDLRLATIYVMPLGGRDATDVVAALERNKRYVRGEIARRVNLKFAPEIRFRVDERFDEAERIEKLLRTPVVQRDLESEKESGDEKDES